MKASLFGASGMVGQGVLRECLVDPTIERVLSIIRNPTDQQDAKLTELVHKDFFDFSSIESQLTGYDACFY
jgi:putative NADH-flavin reductase